MIEKHKFTEEKWYISIDTPYIFGKLQVDAVLTSQRTFDWFDSEDSFLDKIDELGIIIETDED